MRSPPTSRPRLILCDFGKNGTAYVETDPVKTEASVVADLLAASMIIRSKWVPSASQKAGHGMSEDIARAVDRGPEAPEGHPQLRREALGRTAGPELIW
jgi:hypothetical protein